MSETKTDNVQEQAPEFRNVLHGLFEQIRSQANTHNRRENRKSSDDEKQSSDSEDISYKWKILLELSESHKMLCGIFSEMSEN